MSVLSSVKFSIFLFPLCCCFFVEINITDKNDSKSVKLVCASPTENLNLRSNHIVLWRGSEFGADEQQQVLETLQTDVLMPNITINSSQRHECFLLANEDAYQSIYPQKRRVSREDLEASVPMENGVCPPGHRIDQDRCYPCFPGSYTSGQDSVCYLCPKDFYMDKKSADSCWPCPEGKKTLAEGADSEDACVYIDEQGHPAVTQNPPWIPIYILIGIIILLCWIVIIILVLRYWKTVRTDSTQSDADNQSTKSMLMSEPDDHIYAEIGDYADDDPYEVPRKPSEPPIYVEVVPDVPQKRPRKLSGSKEKHQSSEHMYEEPIAKKYDGPREDSEHMYEVPIPKSSERPQADSEHMYEVPIPKSSERPQADSEHIYEELIYKNSEESYINEAPKGRSVSDERMIKQNRYRSYSKDYNQEQEESEDTNDFYEEPISKQTDSNSYEVPIQRFTSNEGSDLVEVDEADINDKFPDISDEVLRRTRSTGFNQANSALKTSGEMPFETRRSSEKYPR